MKASIALSNFKSVGKIKYGRLRNGRLTVVVEDKTIQPIESAQFIGSTLLLLKTDREYFLVDLVTGKLASRTEQPDNWEEAIKYQLLVMMAKTQRRTEAMILMAKVSGLRAFLAEETEIDKNIIPVISAVYSNGYLAKYNDIKKIYFKDRGVYRGFIAKGYADLSKTEKIVMASSEEDNEKWSILRIAKEKIEEMFTGEKESCEMYIEEVYCKQGISSAGTLED